MFNFYNSSVIYVSQSCGHDSFYNGLSPEVDGLGNGPYKTLERALASVAERRVTGFMRPVTIALTEDYYTDSTITMDHNKAVHSKDVVLNGITIESYRGRKKIVGGMKITGWKKDTFNGAACISAELPLKKDVTRWEFTDLFVNGKRADNTRYPREGTLTAIRTEKDYQATDSIPYGDGSRWFIAHKEDLEGIEGIEEATVNFCHLWVDEHTHIESYDRESGKLSFRYPSRYTATTIYEPKEHPTALRYYLENLPTMFGEVNDWYLDRAAGKMYYIPEGEADLDTIEVYVPTVKKLFEIHGTDEERVRDIRIRNLELMCTRSDYVSTKERNPVTGQYEETAIPDGGYATDVQSAALVYGAVSFRNAERCSLSSCLIHHIGTHAVEIMTGCRGIRIEDNEIDDIGGGGVKIFGGAAGCEEKEITENCVIRGNRITNGGKRFIAACGILLCHARNCEISDNEIGYFGYSGISAGWIWGYAESATYGNLIKGNHIHHIGRGTLSDMGGIYLLGRQPGTVVLGNRIHDVVYANYGGYGIYTDEGASYITIENNVVYHTQSPCLHQHYGSCNIVRNNIFALSGGCVTLTREEMHDGISFENNIFVTEEKPVYHNCHVFATINAKNNLFFNPTGKPLYLFESSETDWWDFDKWTKECGKDIGSVVADPGFADIEHYDFTISEDSPAVKLGFQLIKGFPATNK